MSDKDWSEAETTLTSLEYTPPKLNKMTKSGYSSLTKPTELSKEEQVELMLSTFK